MEALIPNASEQGAARMAFPIALFDIFLSVCNRKHLCQAMVTKARRGQNRARPPGSRGYQSKLKNR
jgi:hypothetical protein